jgi:hypothetical protein
VNLSREAFAFDDDSDVDFSSMTLAELVALARSSESILDMPPERIDPESVVGKLVLDPEAGEEFREAHKAKIDGIVALINDAEALAARWEARKKKAHARVAAARRIIDWYEFYLKSQLNLSQADKFIGNEFEIVARTSPTPTVATSKDPSPAMAVKYPDLLKRVPESWTYSNAAILEQLKPFYKAIRENGECSNCQGRGQVKETFEGICGDSVSEAYVVECSHCYGTGKDIGDVEVPDCIEFARLNWSKWIELKEYDNRDVITKPRVKKKKTKKEG